MKPKGTDTVDALTFQRQVRQLEKLMYRVSMSYLSNNEDAADAVQDALTIAWEKRNHLKKPEQFKPWLMRILANRCIDMLRRRRRISFFPIREDSVVAPPPHPSPVMEAVGRLKPELRLVVTLYYVDGYSVGDIAEALGMASGTVKTRLYSARKQLSQTLRVEWEEEP